MRHLLALTVGLSVVVLLPLSNVLIEVGLLLAVGVAAVLHALLPVVHGPQALVDALVVVAHRALVVCLPRLPFEALTNQEEEEKQVFKWSAIE